MGEGEIENADRTKRPLSPHLTVFQADADDDDVHGASHLRRRALCRRAVCWRFISSASPSGRALRRGLLDRQRLFRPSDRLSLHLGAVSPSPWRRAPRPVGPWPLHGPQGSRIPCASDARGRIGLTLLGGSLGSLRLILRRPQGGINDDLSNWLQERQDRPAEPPIESDHSGRRHAHFMRLSSYALAPLGLFVAWWLIGVVGKPFEAARAEIGRPFPALMLIAFDRRRRFMRAMASMTSSRIMSMTTS